MRGLGISFVIIAAFGGCRAEAPSPPPPPESPLPPAPTACGHVPELDGERLVTHPFEGICIVHWTTHQPRPLSIHGVVIDPQADGIDFRLSGPNGDAPRETTLQTTREFLRERGAQLAINAHFFRPWPSVDEYADLLGLAVSEGQAYSPFDEEYSVALTFDGENRPRIVSATEGTTNPDGHPIQTGIGATERILAAGKNVATWKELHPRTAAGIRTDGRLVFLLVDGRKKGFSEGMTTLEVADLMARFGVVDAINLDGGGSTALAIADPVARLVNVPGKDPDTERPVGASLAVFAKPVGAPGQTPELIAHEPFDYGPRDWGTGSSRRRRGHGVGGLLRGVGWGSAWHDRHGLDRLSGIAASGPRDELLTYVDVDGRRLSTAGGSLRTAKGGASAAWRVLDLTRAGTDSAEPTGLGRDGSTTWLSFLGRCQEPGNPTRDREGISLGSGLTVGPTGDDRWGVWASDDAAASDTTCERPTFIVLRLEFREGSEHATLWINPPLTGELPEGNAALQVPDFRFAEVSISSHRSLDLDELRIGTSFAAVAPTAH